MQSPRIAIIGAGMAGIACAHALRQHGASPTVLEKSGGLGGRLATRRTSEGDAFDHGAQYVTAHGPSFDQLLERLRQAGAAAIWRPTDPDRAPSAAHPWMIGTPAMNALLKPLAEGIDVRRETSVRALQRDGQGWLVHTDADTPPGLFDAVVCTAPAPQTHALFGVEPMLQKALERVQMAPCWAAMLRFAQPLPLAFDARRFPQGAIAWVARQASRPGREREQHAWVVHASPDWSRAHLEDTPEQVLGEIGRELASLLDAPLPATVHAAAHRWRHALTTQPLGQPCLINRDGTLYAAGDWCLGARVELACESGVAAATALIDAFKRKQDAQHR